MNNKKGQALVEMAIVLPFLLVLVCGIADFGRYMYEKNTLTNEARSAARKAAVLSPLSPIAPASGSPFLANPGTSFATQLVTETLLDESVIHELKILDSLGVSKGGTATTGDQVKVILTWPNFQMVTPLYKILAMMTNSTPKDNSLTIKCEATMRYE